MKNSLLLHLVLKLTDKQVREVKKWIRSPMYNHREDVVKLFDLLAKIRKQGKSEITKETVFNKIYSKQKYDDGKIRLIMTFLQKNVEQYLVQQSLLEEDSYEIRLATIYRKMNLHRHFERQINKIGKDQEKARNQNADFYENNAKVEWEKYHFASMKRRQGEVHLQEAGDYLDIAYFAKKLEQACYIITHQNLYKKEYRQALLPQILTHIKEEKLYDTPVVSIFYHCYMALSQDPEDGWFDKFSEELDKHKELFPEDNLRSLYILALNFLTKQYNAGNRSYLIEWFNMYREGLEQGFLLSDGILSRFSYRNILTVCIAAGQLDYGATFNEKFIDKVEIKYRETALNFNQGRLAYHNKQYKKALLYLQNIEFEEFYTQIAAKIISLKIFFETKEWDVFNNFLDNLKTQIYRKKDIGYHKENYLNFIKYARKLSQLNSMNKSAKQKLLDNINAEKRLAEHQWLVDQIK